MVSLNRFSIRASPFHDPGLRTSGNVRRTDSAGVTLSMLRNSRIQPLTICPGALFDVNLGCHTVPGPLNPRARHLCLTVSTMNETATLLRKRAEAVGLCKATRGSHRHRSKAADESIRSGWYAYRSDGAAYGRRSASDLIQRASSEVRESYALQSQWNVRIAAIRSLPVARKLEGASEFSAQIRNDKSRSGNSSVEAILAEDEHQS